MNGARAAAGVLATLLSCAAAADASLCPDALRTVFSCRSGTKTISVCASADARLLQYRFGTPSATELVLPSTNDGTHGSIQAGRLSFSGGGGATLAFTAGAYRYTVYTAVGSGWGSKAGVVVDKHERRIASLRCSAAVYSELGPQLFDEAGLAADPRAFELP